MTFNAIEQAAINAQQNAARAWDDLMTAKVCRRSTEEVAAFQAAYDAASRIENAALHRLDPA
jgi:hypothetical protein